MPAYAVQRFFVHASGYVFGPAAVGVIAFLARGEFKNASISAGVATATFSYWMAFHERRDFEPEKRPTSPGRAASRERSSRPQLPE